LTQFDPLKWADFRALGRSKQRETAFRVSETASPKIAVSVLHVMRKFLFEVGSISMIIYVYIYISIWLVVWNIFYDCPYVGNVIITDELHHFSEG